MSLRYFVFIVVFASSMVVAQESDRNNKFGSFNPWGSSGDTPTEAKKKTMSSSKKSSSSSSWDSSDWNSWDSGSSKKKSGSSSFGSKSGKNPFSAWHKETQGKWKADTEDDLRDDIDELKNMMKKMPSLESMKDEFRNALSGDRNRKKPEDDQKVKFHWELATEDGWNLGLDLGFNIDWDINSLIPGTDDGANTKLGGKVSFIAGYLKGNHEWRNKITIQEAFSKIPAQDDWVKSTDLFSFETTYYWSPGKWWGTYAEISLDTSIFPGVDIEERPADYHIVDPYGVPIRTIENATRLDLDTWFMPLHMDEFGGLFIRPVKIPEFTIELKVAAFTHQTYADGQLMFQERSGQDITIRELSSFFQIGGSVGTDFYGILSSISTKYRLSFDVGYSFYNTDTVSLTDSKFTNGLNMKLTSTVLVQPFSWVGIAWDFRLVRLPNMNSDFQVESNIYLDVPIEF